MTIRLCMFGVVFVLSLVPVPGTTALLDFEARQRLDLSGYSVKIPGAGIVDIERRRKELGNFKGWLFERARHAVRRFACKDVLELPKIDFELAMPAFYQRPDAWRQAIKPLFAFEDALTHLAGASLLETDGYSASCLLRVLDNWARSDALTSFRYSSDDRQAWYNTEDMLFAAGHAYASVRGRLPDMADVETRIDSWLTRASRNHIAIAGGTNSCCNNHFYRRALHAAIVGATVGDDELFRFGVSALYSALHEMKPDGGLPRELSRPGRAIHYQNYALLYLIPIAEIVTRQGYGPYEWLISGRQLSLAVQYAVRLMRSPEMIRDLDPVSQNLDFMADRQYFAWAEIWLSRFDNPELEEIVSELRPIVNRSAVGHASLMFYGFPSRN